MESLLLTYRNKKLWDYDYLKNALLMFSPKFQNDVTKTIDIMYQIYL